MAVEEFDPAIVAASDIAKAVSDMIDGIFKMMRKEFHRLTLKFSFS